MQGLTLYVIRTINMEVGKSSDSKNKKDAVFLPLTFAAVVIIGILGLLLMQRLANKNRLICTYIGRLWMLDKDINEPGFYKCYTYDQYYSYP